MIHKHQRQEQLIAIDCYLTIRPHHNLRNSQTQTHLHLLQIDPRSINDNTNLKNMWRYDLFGKNLSIFLNYLITDNFVLLLLTLI